MPSLWLRSHRWSINGLTTEEQRNYNGGEGMIIQLEYNLFEDLFDMNLWLMKHPNVNVINVETMNDERLKLWYRV